MSLPYRVIEVDPPPELRRLVECSYTATFDGGRYDLVPDGCVDVIVGQDGRPEVCGPESSGWSFQLPAGSTTVGIRLRPAVAPLVLDTWCQEIAERRVDLAQVTTDRFGRRLGDRLSSVPAGERRRRLLLDAFRGPLLDLDLDRLPPVGRALARLDRSVTEVAADLGWSRRHLQRLTWRWLGHDPTTFRRVLRADRAQLLLRCQPDATLATVAATCGFSDQSHLVRELEAIAGRSPSRIRLGRHQGGTGTDAVRIGHRAALQRRAVDPVPSVQDRHRVRSLR